jgi:hypothetical protein
MNPRRIVALTLAIILLMLVALTLVGADRENRHRAVALGRTAASFGDVIASDSARVGVAVGAALRGVAVVIR